MTDPFALPADAPTEGFEYQWRRLPELGDKKDAERWSALLDAGFLPYLRNGRPVDVKGLRLMRKPTETVLTQRIVDFVAAREARDRQVRKAFKGLPVEAKAGFDGKPVVITAGHGAHRHGAVLAPTPPEPENGGPEQIPAP